MTIAELRALFVEATSQSSRRADEATREYKRAGVKMLPALLDAVEAAQALDQTFDADGLVMKESRQLRLALRAALAKVQS